MAAAQSHPFFPALTDPTAVDWAEAAWRSQPMLTRHYIEATAAELHDALLGKAFHVRVVLPPVVTLNGELVRLPLNAPQPLIGGLWATLRQHPVDEDVAPALHALCQHTHPAVAEAGMLLAYRVGYLLAFRDVPPSPRLLAEHEPFGEDGRLWGRIEAAQARIAQLAHWQHLLTLAAQVYPALLDDVYYQRSCAVVGQKYAAQSAHLEAYRA